MENVPKLYLLFSLAGCLLALIAIWSRRNLVVRVIAVGVLVCLLAINYSSLQDLLGRPEPVDHDDFRNNDGDTVVLAASIDEGIAIYLWLRHPGVRQPRYYAMEWDHEAAVALKRALERSLRDNSTVMMNPNYEPSLEKNKEPLFYALPQQRLPLKPDPGMFEYRNPNNPI